jgi:hypothetical protein
MKPETKTKEKISKTENCCFERSIKFSGKLTKNKGEWAGGVI